MPEQTSSIVRDICIALITTGITGIFSQVYFRLLKWRQLRHLGHLRTKDGIIKIVIPTILKASFPKDHFSENAIIPDNIPLMPMPEGRALANLVSGISDAIRGVDIKFVTHNDFVDDGVTPFVSIGGPSVNEVSREILNQMVPGFRIQYPDHIGYFGSRKMSPRVEKGILLEDFGFLFQGKSRLGTRCIVVCGVWATGTELACVTYAGSVQNDSVSKVRRLLFRQSELFVVLKATVQNYQIGEPKLDAYSENPSRL